MKDASSRRQLGSKQLTCWLGLALLLVPASLRATDPSFINSGLINFPVQIDAFNFVNSGSFFVNSALPFETSNTRNYTNSGTMSGAPGFFFDNAAPNSGPRSMSDSFVNLNSGVVQALDGGGLINIGNVIGFLQGVAPSYLWINATNVVNSGTLSVGGSGWLKIQATNVNAARGAFEVTALVPTGSANFGTNYFNDVGIKDVWWGQTNIAFNSSTVYNGNRAATPPHQVFVGLANTPNIVSFSVQQPLAFGYSNATSLVPITLTNVDGSTTNLFLPTNIVKQAVFIGGADPAISVDVRFFPSSTFTNPYQTACVRFVLPATNVITGTLDQTTLYFYDTLASETNRGLNVNTATTSLPPFLFQRPANYLLSRLDSQGRFAAGTPGNITPDPLYVLDPTVTTNPLAVGEYSGYRATVDNLSSEPPPVTPGTVTNFPGRVQLYADSLDLRNTRMRGEGEIIVKANHLLSSANAAVDCENLSYTLGSTNGNLHFVNLSKQSVTRLKGEVLAWSGIWTNQADFILTNNFAVTNITDTNGVITGTNAVQSPITNSANVDIHVLILDAQLIARVPVITWDVAIHSTNILVSDSMSVVQTFLLDGESFTLDGTINLTSTSLQNVFGQSVTTELTEWVYTNAPGLLYFTNNGTLTVPSEAHFGDDRPIPYADFVNAGTLNAGSVSVNSGFIANSGILSASVGPLEVEGGMGVFQNGQTTSGGDVDITLASIKFNNHQLAASDAINFTVTGGLSDAGPSSGNVFRAGDGFNLLVKPASGDLLGTTFQDQPPNFIEAVHTWAAEDRGSSPAGYSDNTAIGKLILTPRNSTPSQAPLFFFTGATGHNGLYVDLLDLTALGTNYLSYLEIDPSITIYYAAATLGFTPPPNSVGIPQQPEEFLNGQFGGHLVWVSSFAGPNSSVDVIINGVTVSVNRALRFSKIIDSNGNGIPNFFDPFPFSSNPLVLSASLVQSNQPPAGSLAVSWNAAAQKVYQVEFTTDVMHPNWKPLTRYTNSAAADSKITIWDTNAPASERRFYRVKVTR